MAIKTVAQMFGDNAGNGAAVPYSTTNPPGTAAANRGIQFGEQLTAAIANRSHVALCLNDEDLNTRLVEWETGGLNAAYRLGAVNTAGGGRLVDVDGGPVELNLEVSGTYDDDKMNAALRVDMGSTVSAGATGIDLVSRYQQLPYTEISVRRTQNLTSASIADPEAGTLNPAAGDSDGLLLGTGNTNITMVPGVDLVEITNTAYAGIYVVLDRVSTTAVTLRALDGTTPSFAADTAVSYRVWRQTAKIGSSPGSTAAFPGGVVLSDTLDFNDTAVLTLIPTAPNGRDSAASLGSRYALGVKNNAVGVLADVFKIDSLGTCIGTPSVDRGNTAQKERALNFGVPGHHIARVGDWGTGYVAFNDDPTKPHFGAVVQERGNLALTVDLSGDQITGILLGYGTNGQLFEITAPSTHAGIYILYNAAASPWIARRLSGVSPAWSAVTGATLRLLQGLSVGGVGSVPVTSPLDLQSPTGFPLGILKNQTVASVRITTPVEVVDTTRTRTALLLQRSSDVSSAYLRCVNRDNLGEDFAVTEGGAVLARGGVQASGYQLSPARAVTRLIPLDAWSRMQASSDGVASKWSRRQGRIVYDRGAGPTAGTPEDMICCISDLLPVGAVVTAVNVRYLADASYVDAMMRLRLSTLDFTSDGTFTNVETFFLDAFTSYTTQTYTLASPETVDREGSTKTYLRFDPNGFAVSPCFISIASVSVVYTYRIL